jgi:hypothetical protein
VSHSKTVEVFVLIVKGDGTSVDVSLSGSGGGNGSGETASLRRGISFYIDTKSHD